MSSQLRYRHTQFGMVILVSLLLTTLLLIILGMVMSEPIVSMGAPVLTGIAAVLFYALTIKIDDTHLRFHFGISLVRKQIPLAEIIGAKPVENSWGYGWGIHHTPDGWLYNVSGLDAVEITLQSGKKMRLGTDEPQKLARVILAAIQKS